MDLTYYNLAAARIETIDAALAWLDAREHGDSENARDLEYERRELETIIDGIELRLAYDAEAVIELSATLSGGRRGNGSRTDRRRCAKLGRHGHRARAARQFCSLNITAG